MRSAGLARQGTHPLVLSPTLPPPAPEDQPAVCKTRCQWHCIGTEAGAAWLLEGWPPRRTSYRLLLLERGPGSTGTAAP